MYAISKKKKKKQGCSLHTEEFTNASQILEMIVAGTTNLGKGVSRIKSNT